ncbi:MAG: tetratricopeptide repeat protein, partial [Acidobacteria bacterium]|nr:tetratricopeptide repeat protein [Acidobacteriota bacterium]
MFGVVRICALCLLASLSFYSFEQGVLVLYVTDTKEKPVRKIMLTCKGGCSQQSIDDTGKVVLRVPSQTRPGDPVTISVVPLAGTDWVLISPWDGRVVTPSFDNRADNFVSVIVGQRGDKDLLRSGKAIETITSRVLNGITPKLDQQVSDEERRLVLKQQADAFGLTPDDVDRAIREWGKTAKDPYEAGLAALYEKNFPRATELLTQSYELRKENFIDAAFFLGQSLYEQGKYSLAAVKFQEVYGLRKDDAGVMNWLGLSLLEAANYAAAEPLLRRALKIDEQSFGPAHPNVATDLNNLAQLLQTTNHLAEAEPLIRRALKIDE